MNKEQLYKLVDEHYRAHFNSLVKRFQRYVQSTHRAEDIVQNAYTRALLYSERAPEDAKDFPKWFNTLVNNCCKDNQKEERLQGMSSQLELPQPEQVPQIPKVIYNQVMERMQKKPEDLRNILELYFVHNYKAAEIAQQVEYSLPWVNRAIYDFRQEIKQEFKWGL